MEGVALAAAERFAPCPSSHMGSGRLGAAGAKRLALEPAAAQPHTPLKPAEDRAAIERYTGLLRAWRTGQRRTSAW